VVAIDPITNFISQADSAGVKGDENPGLAVLQDPVGQELHAQNGFAGAGAAADKRCAPGGQTTARNLVETFNACRCFG
jgi:hypothetical protein